MVQFCALHEIWLFDEISIIRPSVSQLTIKHFYFRSGDDDIHIDIDSLDDPESESVRDALWEENSTTSSPTGSTVSTSSKSMFFS